MLTLQAPKSSPISFLKLDAGLFAGNGIRPDIDSKLDFIGRLSASKTIDNISISGGVSLYHGGQLLFNPTDTVYLYKVENSH